MRFPWTKKLDAPEPEAAAPVFSREDAVEIATSIARSEASTVARAEGRSAALESVSAATEEALVKIEKSAIEKSLLERASLSPVPDTGGNPAFGNGVSFPNTPWAGAGPQKPTYPAYHYDDPLWYSTPVPPQRRPGSIVSIKTLRAMADNYDVLRACIQHLKREVSQVPIQVAPLNAKDDRRKTKQAVKEASAFFSQAGGLGGVGKRRSHFEGEVIEDLCIVGATAVFWQQDRMGRPLEAVALDAATIRPKVDGFGWPGPGDFVYEQWVWGVLSAEFTRDQLVYDGLSSRSYTPYFASPVEWLVNAVNSALRADDWNRKWLTDGNTPSDLLAVPDTWTPEQIKDFSAFFDAMMSGDSAQRQRTKFVPSGTNRVQGASRKDSDFQEFELWLLRRTCAIMGVQPASLGFAGEQYKVSQGDSMESTSQFGAGVLLDFRKETYDDAIRRMGYADLVEVQNVTSREEKATERATRNAQLVSGGIKTPNEARQEEGLEADPLGDQLIVSGIVSSLRYVLNPPVPPPIGSDPGADNLTKPGDAEAPEKAEKQRAALVEWENRAINALRFTGSTRGLLSYDPRLPIPLVTVVRAELAGCRTKGEVKELFRALASPSLYLVRHAPTPLSAKCSIGWLNEDLSKDGRKEAKKIGRFLCGRGITRLVSSDLKRTVETAKAAEKATGAPLLVREQNLRAWDVGDYEGKPSKQFKRVEDDFCGPLAAQPLPGGESFNAFTARYLAALRSILDDLAAGTYGTTAAFTHSPCLKLTLAWVAAGCPAVDPANPSAGLPAGAFLSADIPMGAVLWLTPTKTKGGQGGWAAKMYDVDAEDEGGQGN